MENYLPISITFEELKTKGFKDLAFGGIDYCESATEEFTIFLYTWGQKFEAVAKTLDEAASIIWNEFCDFINGRS